MSTKQSLMKYDSVDNKITITIKTYLFSLFFKSGIGSESFSITSKLASGSLNFMRASSSAWGSRTAREYQQENRHGVGKKRAKTITGLSALVMKFRGYAHKQTHTHTNIHGKISTYQNVRMCFFRQKSETDRKSDINREWQKRISTPSAFGWDECDRCVFQRIKQNETSTVWIFTARPNWEANPG